MCLLKQKLYHDENYEDTWESKKDGWSPSVKNDVLLSGFAYARYSKEMEIITGLGM